MSSEIKNEFKEFISTLSTEICKEVMLEELKNINNSFNQTSNTYKAISNSYTESISNIKEQLSQLQTTNKKLNEFIANTNVNNEKVGKALDIIEGSHRKVIDSIVSDNKRLFEMYSKNIQAINEKERNTFISALVRSISTESQKYIMELKNIVNGSRIEDISKNIEFLIKKIEVVDKVIYETRKDIKASEIKIVDELGTKLLGVDNRLKAQIDQINNKIASTSNELNGRVSALSDQINKKNNVIAALTSIVIFLCIIILFKK